MHVDTSKARPHIHVLSGTFLSALFTHFCLIDLLSVPLTLFHVLTSVLISPPLTAVVLLSLCQTGLSEYVHGLS